ncbi:MAG: class I SAM-dependent methyltransferase [Bacteroidota bacterium]
MKRCPKNWKDYELIDCGEGLRLDRFGSVVLIRPEPKAIWQRSLSNSEWEQKAHARFEQKSSNSGAWSRFKRSPDQWSINYSINNKKFVFDLKLTRFKHVGIFPEQAINWELIHRNIAKGQRFLNLFAYTGASSIVARANQANVYHVDSIKQVLSWGKRNMELNGIADIRWVLEDALKFAQREAKRNHKYDFIIMDPPSFGHGPKGGKWSLADKINELLHTCNELLSENGVLVWNNYSLGLSELTIETLLKSHFPKSKISADELYLEDQFGKKLSMGVIGKVSN